MKTETKNNGLKTADLKRATNNLDSFINDMDKKSSERELDLEAYLDTPKDSVKELDPDKMKELKSIREQIGSVVDSEDTIYIVDNDEIELKNLRKTLEKIDNHKMQELKDISNEVEDIVGSKYKIFVVDQDEPELDNFKESEELDIELEKYSKKVKQTLEKIESDNTEDLKDTMSQDESAQKSYNDNFIDKQYEKYLENFKNEDNSPEQGRDLLEVVKEVYKKIENLAEQIKNTGRVEIVDENKGSLENYNTESMLVSDYQLYFGTNMLLYNTVNSKYIKKHFKKMRKRITKKVGITLHPIHLKDNDLLAHNIVELNYKNRAIRGFEFNKFSKKSFKKLLKKLEKAIEIDFIKQSKKSSEK